MTAYAEVAFWRDTTGRPLEQGRRPEFAFLGDDGRLRILLQCSPRPADRSTASPTATR